MLELGIGRFAGAARPEDSCPRGGGGRALSAPKPGLAWFSTGSEQHGGKLSFPYPGAARFLPSPQRSCGAPAAVPRSSLCSQSRPKAKSPPLSHPGSGEVPAGSPRAIGDPSSRQPQGNPHRLFSLLRKRDQVKDPRKNWGPSDTRQLELVISSLSKAECCKITTLNT
jgi:hypothetical protein